MPACRVVAAGGDNGPDGGRAFGLLARIGFSTLPVIAAVILYGAIGMPQIPSRPYAERAGERNLAAAAAAATDVTDPDFQTDQQIRRLLSQIVLSLEANPRNLQGWVVLARGSLRLGDIERAVAALRVPMRFPVIIRYSPLNMPTRASPPNKARLIRCPAI